MNLIYPRRCVMFLVSGYNYRAEKVKKKFYFCGNEKFYLLHKMKCNCRFLCAVLYLSFQWKKSTHFGGFIV